MNNTRAELQKTCIPEAGTEGKFRSLVYAPEDQAIWRGFFAEQNTISASVHPLVLSGLLKLGISADAIKNLAALNGALKDACGWQLVEVDGLVPEPEHLLLLEKKIFPCSSLLRPPSGFFPWPDYLHEVFHLPLMMEPSYSAFLSELGAVAARAIAAGRQDLLSGVNRIYWYLVEYGAVATAGGIKFYGASLSSYHPEARYLSAHPSLLVKFGRMDEVAATPLPWEESDSYEMPQFQKRYFVAESFAWLLGSLRDWKARELGA